MAEDGTIQGGAAEGPVTAAHPGEKGTPAAGDTAQTGTGETEMIVDQSIFVERGVWVLLVVDLVIDLVILQWIWLIGSTDF